MRIVSKLPNMWRRNPKPDNKKGWVELKVKGTQEGKQPVAKGSKPVAKKSLYGAKPLPKTEPRPIPPHGKKTHWVMIIIAAVVILGGVAAFFLLGQGEFVGQAVKFQEEASLSLDANNGGFIVLQDAKDSFLEIDSSQKFPVYANVGTATGKVFEATITLDPSIKTLSADAWASSDGTIFEQRTNADGTLTIVGAFLDGFTGKIKLFDIELQGKTEKDSGTVKIDLSVYEDVDGINDLITTDVDGSFKVGAPKKEVTGCIDLKATNYNKVATKDDGSCAYECTKSEECGDFGLTGTCTDNKCVYCKDDKFCTDNPTAGGQYCSDGKCVMCNTDQQCVDGKLGQFCASGYCQQCKVNADCGTGTCEGGACSYSCKEDTECAPGTCMKAGGVTEGTCQAPENYKGTINVGEKCDMKKSYECVEGSWCENGVCAKPAEVAGGCTAGEIQCDGKDVQQCTAGAWTTSETCKDGCKDGACVVKVTKEVCNNGIDDNNDNKIDCQDQAACPTSTSCGTEGKVCTATGLCEKPAGTVTLTCTPTCPAGATCTAGVCMCATGTYDATKNECVTVSALKGDIDGNGCVEIVNLISYIKDWKAGSVKITDLIQGINNWKSGTGCK